MLVNLLVIILLLISLHFIIAHNNNNPSEEECSDRIHRKCTHPEKYTEQEVENVRIYLQKRFAKTNPIRKPCTKLHVRKDIKCMSEKEIQDLIDVVKQLYANGVVTKLAQIHYMYWAAAHKFVEGINWHKLLVNEFEKEMMKINPNVTMPYWAFHSEFIGAEKSIVFSYFGHAGTADNDYCVLDGMLPNMTCNFPNTHCVRRQWNSDNTTPIWEPPEWATAGIQMGIRPEILLTGAALGSKYFTREQMSHIVKLFLYIFTKSAVNVNAVRFKCILKDFLKHKFTQKSFSLTNTQLYFQLLILMSLNDHFKTHLSLGGWVGDLSLKYAPCDFIFYLFHAGHHIDFLKWQLQNDENLVPESYSLALKYITESQTITAADLNTDTFNYYRNITVREYFQMGYGEQCYIYDVFIKPINDIIKKKKPKLPRAYYRLKSTLPPNIFAKYFPKFALCPKEVTFFDHVFDNLGNCNPLRNGICRLLPIALNMTETANGRRQYEAFRDDANENLTPVFNAGENLFVQFMKDLNKYGYCSQYA